MTQPANFEALLGGFLPPSSSFSKLEVEVGMRRKKMKGVEFGRERDVEGRGRGGRQLTTDQVSILGSFFPDFLLPHPLFEGMFRYH